MLYVYIIISTALLLEQRLIFYFLCGIQWVEGGTMASNRLPLRQKNVPGTLDSVSLLHTRGAPDQDPEDLLHSAIVHPLASLISGFPCKDSREFTTLMHPIVFQSNKKAGFCSQEFSDGGMSTSYVTMQTSR